MIHNSPMVRVVVSFGLWCTENMGTWLLLGDDPPLDGLEQATFSFSLVDCTCWIWLDFSLSIATTCGYSV